MGPGHLLCSVWRDPQSHTSWSFTFLPLSLQTYLPASRGSCLWTRANTQRCTLTLVTFPVQEKIAKPCYALGNEYFGFILQVLTKNECMLTREDANQATCAHQSG